MPYKDPEERKKISERFKGKPSGRKGKPWSPEMREKILKARIGKKRGP